MARDDDLKAEIINDPLGIGYSAMSDEEVADSLNALTRTRIRNRMESSEVFNAVDVAEFLALADGNQNTIMQILAFGSVNPAGREADVFIAIFGAGSVTVTALAAARQEAISRATELNLGVVKSGDVQFARR